LDWVAVPSPVWRHSGLCRALQADFGLPRERAPLNAQDPSPAGRAEHWTEFTVPAALHLHPDIVAWCGVSGLSDATLAHELYAVDGPEQWRDYLMECHVERRFPVSAAATRMLQHWWRADVTLAGPGTQSPVSGLGALGPAARWASHWVAIMQCADYWQIDSLYWRMLVMVHRRYDELSPDHVEALVGVRPGPVPHLGA